MWQKWKNFLKWFLPPPTKAFNREVDRILGEISRKERETVSLLMEEIAKRERNTVSLLMEEIGKQERNTVSLLMEEIAKREQETVTSLMEVHEKELLTLENILTDTRENSEKLERIHFFNESKYLELKKGIRESQTKGIQARRAATESVWGHIFTHTISESQWLHHKTFSPGRWAIGYPALYTLYRILDEVKPLHILELGLGQSTKMISQYASSHKNVVHKVVEHDQEWIDFFKTNYTIPVNTEIVPLEREMVPFKETEVRVFKNFKETFGNDVFDLIFIDAPLGGDMKIYARIDVISLLPRCLSKNFMILIDDFERSGEKSTVELMKESLLEHGISFSQGRYEGQKDLGIITSESLKFVTSM